MKIVLIVVVAMVVICGGFAWFLMSNMQKDAVPIVEATPVPEDYTDEVLEATEAPAAEVISMEAAEATPQPIAKTEKKDEDIVNFLLVGTDSRDANNTEVEGRSDTMMVASYNKTENKITLVSFMRDLEVTRIGEKSKFKGKLNAAYSMGGIGELINTINLADNFDLDVQKYVSVGFAGFWLLIDGIDGIDVNLSKEEAYFINWRCAELYKADDKSDRFTRLENLNKRICNAEPNSKGKLEEVDGPYRLYGEQALWYCRDRYSEVFGGAGDGEDKNGNSDAGRIRRQQYLFKKVYEKVLDPNNFNFATLNAIYDYASSYIKTNLNPADLIELAFSIYQNRPEIVSVRIPFDKQYSTSKKATNDEGEEVDQEGVFMTKAQWKDCRTRLHEALYGTGTQASATPDPDADDS